MAKKKMREVRVASVNANEILARDLRGTGVWIGIAFVAVVVMAVVYNFVM